MSDVNHLTPFYRSRLETQFYEGYVVHTQLVADLSAGQRRRAVTCKWTEQREIGSGGFGVVSLELNDTGRTRAVKRLMLGQNVNYTQELRALTEVSDRDDLFVKFEGWYQNSRFLFLAMEYIPHGDLSNMIRDGNAKSNASEITKQLLEGLSVLHDRNICHRDLKPQNILIASPKPIWVKIADFGVSKQTDGTGLHTHIGTRAYLAPEILGGLLPSRAGSNKYTEAVDLWALRCVVYEILTSQLPFQNSTGSFLFSDFSGVASVLPPAEPDFGLLESFCSGKTPFPDHALRQFNTSDYAMDLVKGLLTANPSSRVSAIDALQSPWLARTEEEPGKAMGWQEHAIATPSQPRDTTAAQHKPSAERTPLDTITPSYRSVSRVPAQSQSHRSLPLGYQTSNSTTSSHSRPTSQSASTAGLNQTKTTHGIPFKATGSPNPGEHHGYRPFAHALAVSVEFGETHTGVVYMAPSNTQPRTLCDRSGRQDFIPPAFNLGHRARGGSLAWNEYANRKDRRDDSISVDYLNELYALLIAQLTMDGHGDREIQFCFITLGYHQFWDGLLQARVMRSKFNSHVCCMMKKFDALVLHCLKRADHGVIFEAVLVEPLTVPIR